MKHTRINTMLFKLEYKMRRAEAEGDAVMVLYYADLIQDLLELQDERPIISKNKSPQGEKMD